MDLTNLSVISQTLESYEETIVFKLIDRAQYAANLITYVAGKSGFRGAGNHSLLELRLRFQEQMDTMFGKYCIPEERPFVNSVSTPRIKAIIDDRGVLLDDCNVVNLTSEIKSGYIRMVPLFCAPGDDGNHGSSVEEDVYALQAISRRIHFGSLYAAESKYTADPQGFGKLITAQDEAGLMEKLTRKEVEDRIIERIREKTIATQATVNRAIRRVIDPDVIVQFYREIIIPVTKKGQILYLMNRKI